MNISTTYLLNVALHAAILSILASLALLTLRQARDRSIAAVIGLLVVGLLPWLTALRPDRPMVATVHETQTQEVVALPIWTVATLAVEPEISTSAAPAAARPNFVFPDPLTTVVTIWAVGSGIGFLLLACAMLRLRTWRKSLSPPDDAAWETLCRLMPEIPSRNHFLVSSATASPCVSGFFRSRIVLPRFLLSSAAEELRWAVRHEIAHWQAGDSRWVILFSLIRCTNWWNPLIHRLVSQWSDAREQLCDLHATGVSENRADYGEFLVTMARKITRRAPPLTVAMSKRRHGGPLKRRIVSLLGANVDSLNPVGRKFIGASSAAFVSCGVLISSVRIDAEGRSNIPNIGTENKDGVTPTVEEPSNEPLPAPRNSDSSFVGPTGNPAAPLVAEEGPYLVKIASKLIRTHKKSAIEGGAILNEVQFQSFMQNAARRKGVDLMTAPSVALKYGHSEMMEIIWEIPGTPAQVLARDPASPLPFTGIRFESKADLIDDRIDLKFDADYRFFPGLPRTMAEITSNHPPGSDPDKIKVVKNIITARMSAGQTLCSDLGEIEPGSFLQVFTTVIPLDVIGRPLDNFKNGKLLPDDNKRNVFIPTLGGRFSDGKTLPPDSLPSSEVKGKLRLHAVLVETPLKTPRPSGEGLVIGLTPSDPKVAAQIKNDPRAKVRRLKTVEMPLNENGTPWPEFPGLNVSAIASKDFKFLSISSHAVGDEPGQFPNLWEELPVGSTMNFGIKMADTTIERRLLLNVEAVK